jgi:hypothetical protein
MMKDRLDKMTPEQHEAYEDALQEYTPAPIPTP